MVINPTWQKIKVKKIPPKDFRALIKGGKYFILDVRSMNSEKNTSFIRGSVLCPLVYLVDWYREIPADHPVAITDWAMKQSPVAAKFLISKGYTVAGVLKGGTKRWESEKFPVEAHKPLTLLIPFSARKREHIHKNAHFFE
jgi:rhodanese-related sulfurtransferase